jgi:hypothetical protein
MRPGTSYEPLHWSDVHCNAIYFWIIVVVEIVHKCNYFSNSKNVPHHLPTSKSSHDLKNPIIVLCLPNLVPSPKWSEIFRINPILSQLVEYKIAFSSSRVIIGHRNHKNVWHLVTTSYYYSKALESNSSNKRIRLFWLFYRPEELKI